MAFVDASFLGGLLFVAVVMGLFLVFGRRHVSSELRLSGLWRRRAKGEPLYASPWLSGYVNGHYLRELIRLHVYANGVTASVRIWGEGRIWFAADAFVADFRDDGVSLSNSAHRVRVIAGPAEVEEFRRALRRQRWERDGDGR